MELEYDDDDDTGPDIVHLPILWMIAPDWKLVFERSQAAFLVCGNTDYGFVEVSMPSGAYHRIIFH